MNELLPIIRQFHYARTERERLQLLLKLPDTVLLKYADVFCKACARAELAAGVDFVNVRVAAMHATRDEAGLLPPGIARELENYRLSFNRAIAGQ